MPRQALSPRVPPPHSYTDMQAAVGSLMYLILEHLNHLSGKWRVLSSHMPVHEGAYECKRRLGFIIYIWEQNAFFRKLTVWSSILRKRIPRFGFISYPINLHYSSLITINSFSFFKHFFRVERLSVRGEIKKQTYMPQRIKQPPAALASSYRKCQRGEFHADLVNIQLR